MYCGKCGKQINDNASFCPYCGAKIENRVPEYKGSAPGSAPAPKQKKKRHTGAIVAVSVAVVLLLIVGISVGSNALIRPSTETNAVTDASGSDASFDASVPEGSLETGSGTADNEDMTLMIYIVGSSLESDVQSKAATVDINEMLNSGIDTDKNNVLLFTGGSTRWWSDVPNDYNALYRIVGDEKEQIAGTQTALDMGDADTLSMFLTYGYENYPAEHYALILWDHGGGPNGGYGYDELYNYDPLTMSELEQALENSPFGGSVRFDWVGYDACLMSSIEIANIWADYADYLIASEESESGYGWDYSFLSACNKTTDPEQIAAAITDSYAEFYIENQNAYFHPDYTLSCLDLSKVSGVLDSMDALFSQMLTDMDETVYTLISRHRNALISFGSGSSDDEEGTSDSYGLIDMEDFAEEISAMYPELTAQLSESLADMIVCNRANLSYAGGVSFYYPVDQVDALYDDLSMPDSYLEFLSVVTDKWEGGNYGSLGTTRETQPAAADEWTFQLTDEQLETMSSITYTVMIESSELFGESGQKLYTPVMMDCSVEPDENGVLHIPKTADLFYMQGTTTKPWSMQQAAETDEYIDYISVNTSLSGATIFPYYELQPIQFAIRVYKETGEWETLYINSISDEGDTVGKTSVYTSDYNSICRTIYGYTAQDSVPYFDWTKSDMSLDWEDEFSGTFMGEWGTSATVIYPVVCQVLMEDVYGRVYTSDLLDMNWNDQQKLSVKTGNGEMIFSILGDSVSLTSYSGSDTEIEIPAYVEYEGYSFPVTSIDNKAFVNNQSLQSVTVPDTVSKIGWKAFYGCKELNTVVLNEGLETIDEGSFAYCTSLVNINIPASVTKIGTAAFGKCYNLRNLTVSSSSRSYKLENGLILSADGTVLVSFTAAATQSDTGNYDCIVPDGVTEIADGAFAYAEYLDRIVLPEGLTRIGNYAFFETAWLYMPTFPDSLTSIGNYAFNLGEYETVYNDSREEEGLPDPQTVVIGPNLLYINTSAFCSDIYAAFEVDEQNPYYSSPEGNLANKNGDYIFCTKYSGEYTALTKEHFMGMALPIPQGGEYSLESDGSASVKFYDSSNNDIDEFRIYAAEYSGTEEIPDPDEDIGFYDDFVISVMEGIDDYYLTRAEITIGGCTAMYYSGTILNGTVQQGFDCAVLANPDNQHFYCIGRIYDLDNAAMSESDFQSFLGSITFDE